MDVLNEEIQKHVQRLNKIDETEEYDGTSWSEVGDLSNATSYANASGGPTAAIAASGLATAYTTACEEWDGAPAVVKTVTVS